MATAYERMEDGGSSPNASNDSDGYRPHPDEPFMCERQQAYFRAKLLNWKEAILRELRTRARQRKLITKIAAAVRRIDEGEYGYCEVTGEPISLGRLEARPIATMTVEAQEQHERQEKVSRED